MSYNIKQVIVVRKDLNMRKGKMCAQVAHASMKFLVDKLKEIEDEDQAVQRFLSEEQNEWLFNGQFAKVVVSVDSEKELLDLIPTAIALNIFFKPIIDSGYTEFNGVSTLTCIAFGPDTKEKLDQLTGSLKLL